MSVPVYAALEDVPAAVIKNVENNYSEPAFYIYDENSIIKIEDTFVYKVNDFEKPINLIMVYDNKVHFPAEFGGFTIQQIRVSKYSTGSAYKDVFLSRVLDNQDSAKDERFSLKSFQRYLENGNINQKIKHSIKSILKWDFYPKHKSAIRSFEEAFDALTFIPLMERVLPVGEENLFGKKEVTKKTEQSLALLRAKNDQGIQSRCFRMGNIPKDKAIKRIYIRITPVNIDSNPIYFMLEK